MATWLWATPYWRGLDTTHRAWERHTDALKPALSLRTRSTAGGALTVMGHSRPHSTASIGPAIQQCMPPGGELARLPVHVQWHYKAGFVSPHLTWAPSRETVVRPTTLRGALVAGATALP